MQNRKKYKTRYAAQGLFSYAPISLFSPDGTFFVVANATDKAQGPQCKFFDSSNAKLLGSVALGEAPYALSLSSDGTALHSIFETDTRVLPVRSFTLQRQLDCERIKKLSTTTGTCFDAYQLFRMYKALVNNDLRAYLQLKDEAHLLKREA